MNDLADCIVDVINSEIALAVLLSEGDKERLRREVRRVLRDDTLIFALRQVAEAAGAEAQFRYGIGGETFAEWIAQYGYLTSGSKLALLTALAALEALDEPAHPVVNIGDTDENADWIKAKRKGK